MREKCIKSSDAVERLEQLMHEANDMVSDHNNSAIIAKSFSREYLYSFLDRE